MTFKLFSSMGFSLCSFFFVVFIFCMYLTKKKYKNIENTIFLILLTLSFLCILSEIAYIYLLSVIDTHQTLTLVACRLFLAFMVSWIVLFSTYVLTIMTNNKDERIKRKNRKILFIIMGLIELFALYIAFTLKIEFFDYTDHLYNFGGDLTIIYILGAITILLTIYAFIIRTDIATGKQKTVISVTVFFVVSTLIIQLIRPESDYNVQNFEFTLLLMSLYFTLENQDNKLLIDLNTQKSESEKASKNQDDFLTSVSHEIKTPLSRIKGLDDILLKEGITNPESAQNSMKTIRLEATKISGFVNNVLDLSNIEANTPIVNENNYDSIISIIELNDSILKRIDTNSISFNMTVDQSIPKTLNGDYKLINKTVYDLISNISYYIDKGSISLNITNKNGSIQYLIASDQSEIPVNEYNNYYVSNDSNNKIKSAVFDYYMAQQYTNILKGNLVTTSKDRYNIGYNFEVTQKIIDNTPIGDISALLKK